MRFQDLLACKKSFALAMRIFELSKSFPKEEILFFDIPNPTFIQKCNSKYYGSLQETRLSKTFSQQTYRL